MNSILEKIISRASSPVFSEEEVPLEKINQLLACAMAANDHGRLSPWRFMVFKGEGRSILASAFANHEIIADNLAQLEKAKSMPYRAPVVICVVVEPRTGKIPLRDQLFSGAAACQLITLAASGMDLASFWRTGKFAQSAIVNRDLGLAENDEIVGFIYIGNAVAIAQSTRSTRENKVVIHG